MKKSFFYLKIGFLSILILLLLEVGFSHPLLANIVKSNQVLKALFGNYEGEEPDFLRKLDLVAQNFEAEVPLCYMTTQDGRTRNLINLCGGLMPKNSEDCSRNSVAKSLAIAQFNYDGMVLTGTVTNQSCKTVRNLKINYTVLDNSGNQIDNGFIFAQPEVVPPGRTASFRGIVTGGTKIQPTHVDWSD